MNDLAQKHKRGPRKEHVNFAAAFTSNNELHGLDLPPKLNRMFCRNPACGKEVIGRATCPHCEEGGK